MVTLKTPTKQIVNQYLQAFKNDDRYQDADNAIEKSVYQFPDHDKIEDVLIKVCLINELYSTSVFNTYQMAVHITELKPDSLISKGAPEAVNKIATGHGIGRDKEKAKKSYNKNERNFYSFATKYCNWHNHEDYPILDNFVSEVLKAYRNQDGFSKFKNKDLRDYHRFKSIMEDFRATYDLKDFNLKSIDKFLWKYGRDLFGKF